MNLGLKGKAALVTGASSGIGKGCAVALAREGCNVIISSRNEDRLMAAADDIEKETGNSVSYLAADVSKKDDVSRLFRFAMEKYGAIHILVNNTGGPVPGYLEQLDDGQWQSAFDNLMMSVVRLTRLCLPRMKEQKYGRIINITSTSVLEPIPNLLLSNSIRPGIVVFSKTLAAQYAQYGITVNNICPGSIATERHGQLVKKMAEEKGIGVDEAERQIIAAIPAGRMGTPMDIGNYAAFLASESAGYITGTTVAIDGCRVRGV